jgi:glycosidase
MGGALREISMKNWRMHALAGLLFAGVAPAAFAATATVYYYTPYKGWSTANIHHNASGSWTTVPGAAMESACTGWVKKTVEFPGTNFQAVFNNGSGSAWDNPNGGGNYTVAAGTHLVKNGALVANAADPCAPVQAQTATVFYKPNTAWTTVNIHYAPTGAQWTTPPGVAMEVACDGWRKKTISLGTATGLAVTFNNGSTWDNNSGRNYALGTGTTTVVNGAVTGNATTPCVVDTTPPSTPAALAGTATGTSVKLDWAASTDTESGVPSYLITRTGGTAGTVVFTSATNSYTDNSGAANTVYNYSVVAVNGVGLKSSASNTAIVKTGEVTITSSTFTWDNATVYFMLNDRFANGDTSNDRSYCRESSQACASFGNDLTQMPSGFHGGDLKGITAKLKANYFKDLGVNALWITAPYEQIHGFVFGGNGAKHYGYHGYYTLDWTAIDKNMGSRADLQELVDTAHAQGIRVVMDIVLNHTGYETLKDMAEYGYGKLNTGWESTAYKSADVLTDYANDVGRYIDTTSSNWATTFWGREWVRMNAVAGMDACEGTDGLKGCVGFLPDVKTEVTSSVGLAPILALKWSREGRLAAEQQKLDTWFAQTGKARSPANHLVKWLSDYVSEFGIDGFRVDTAKHVDMNVWKDLKAESVKARQAWLASNPAKAAALKGETAFWMTGEVWGHGVGRSAYFDNGFDSLINFNFQGAAGNTAGLNATYTELASVNANNSTPFNMLSYISSHDKGLFDRGNLQTGLTSLLLAPGGVQIFYGDESGRPLMGNWTGDHAWRGDMNWNSTNATLLAHAKKLGQFRNAHVAVGAGTHSKLADAPFTFSRVKDSDKVVVAIGAGGRAAISVAGIFADGTVVRDAYTGALATVAAGKASVDVGSAGVVLLEAASGN